ncbi:MAG TPA: multifunctional oxoglutarate decarboxylase/oxoglutarate dehydrogenase thiamine pyrophosphate-binding subunit/dihydrolipoyllysine-residue succinyltransferase subunit [Gaiellaceae bacterium]
MDVDALNAGYAAVLLEDYLENPETVPAEWRALFESAPDEVLDAYPGLRRLVEALGDGNGHAAPVALPEPPPAAEAPTAPDEPPPPAPEAPPAPAEALQPVADPELVGGVAAAMALVKAYRMHGHLAARLDPLGSEPPGDPALEPERLIPRLTPELQARIPASVLRLYVPGETLAEALPHLRETYCGTIAYEIEHISEHEERVWLRQAIESGRYRGSLTDEEKVRLLRRLTDVEGMEHYLRRSFLGQKQFSIEGLDVMLPMLDEAIELAADSGAHEIVIGMAHRGRLNVLAHLVGRPYEVILREFEGERTIDAVVSSDEGGTGDVKYHLGAQGTRTTAAGEITVSLASNPSHLEAVDPVVEGRTRAEQTDRSTRDGRHDPAVALPVLIHGDASFAGQGVVAETFNLEALEGYSTGGTLHLIANNQVGFTTDPEQGRSTRYSSDMAKGFDIPIVHVNADDPEAAIAAVRLAMAYREKFGHDVVVDLVGYRRFGHNEQDEPAYTQPLLARLIADQSTVREQFAARLADAGLVSSEDAEQLYADVQGKLKEAHEHLRQSLTGAAQVTRDGRIPAAAGDEFVTSVPAERLRELNEQLLGVPEGFTVHPKLAKQLERRRQTLDEGGIDWGQAEALACASLLVEGIPVRLTGQDTERGTFSHRHVVLHDAETGVTYTPMQNLPGASASFEVHNSPLSELAALGFEYGYSVAAPEALVVWEAQFGDFVNGAQIILDQFVVAGLAKWGETSRLTLLLPHGYEGNGPEHSSARLERFLQLAAQENIRVANCTTAAQHFHLLRRQALDVTARPLVVMTPKGLLRLKQASSTLEELESGRFETVLEEPVADRERVRRLVLCSGKLYYDIAGHERRPGAEGVAVVRIEQLYPFPVDRAHDVICSYPTLDEIVWAQEEPQNMGAWRAIRHRLEEAKPEGTPLRFVGRPWRAAPSEGYPTAHLREQDRIVRAALGVQ